MTTQDKVDQQILARSAEDDRREYWLGTMLDTYTGAIAAAGGRALGTEQEDALLGALDQVYGVLVIAFEGNVPAPGGAEPNKATKGLFSFLVPPALRTL